MVVPVDREGKVEDSTLLRREPTASTSLEAVSTRKAGGRQLNQQTQTVSKSVWCMTHIANSFLANTWLMLCNILHDFWDEVHTVLCVNCTTYNIMCRFWWIFVSSEVLYHLCCTNEALKLTHSPLKWVQPPLTHNCVYLCKKCGLLRISIVYINVAYCFAGWWLYFDSRRMCREEECEWSHWITEFRKTVSVHQV